MKIRKVGWTSFVISTDNISIITDPLLLKESGASFTKSQADVVLFTDYGKEVKKTILEDNSIDSKVVPDKRDKIMEISTPGEYEIGGAMIRRNIGQKFYIIDEKDYRVVYMGGTDKDFNPQCIKNWGDVDILILPIGDSEHFMDYDKMEKLISNVDPAVIVPCAYKEDGSNIDGLKSKDEFLKYFGYVNVQEENYLTVTKKQVEEEQTSVKVVFLK